MQGDGPPLSTVCHVAHVGGLKSGTARGTSDGVTGGHEERATTTRALLLALMVHALLNATMVAVPAIPAVPAVPAILAILAIPVARHAPVEEAARPSAAPPTARRVELAMLLNSKVLR